MAFLLPRFRLTSDWLPRRVRSDRCQHHIAGHQSLGLESMSMDLCVHHLPCRVLLRSTNSIGRSLKKDMTVYPHRVTSNLILFLLTLLSFELGVKNVRKHFFLNVLKHFCSGIFEIGRNFGNCLKASIQTRMHSSMMRTART